MCFVKWSFNEKFKKNRSFFKEAWNGFSLLRNSAGRRAIKQHNARLMDGKLTVTLPPNESQSTTLCIIFMLMRATRQLFCPAGKTQAFFVLYFCLSYCKTQNRLSISVRVKTHKEVVLISVTLEGELHINIFQKIQSAQKIKNKNNKNKTTHTDTRLELWLWFCLTPCKGRGLTVGAVCLNNVRGVKERRVLKSSNIFSLDFLRVPAALKQITNNCVRECCQITCLSYDAKRKNQPKNEAMKLNYNYRQFLFYKYY